jgi:5'-3' exonuclease
MGTTMLLDAASMYFRAFYGVPQDTMRAPDGTPVNAVRGLLDMIATLLRSRHPDRLLACMDASWRPAFVAVLDAVGIAMKWADGYEADDIIGTLAAQAIEPVEVVTGDRDLFQVVDDARGIRVAYIGKGVARMELIDEAEVTRRYEIPGRSYAAFAALRGDPSDGLPGVPGVGEKTAAALVRVFGSVEAMLTAIDAGYGGFPPGSRAKLVAARPYLEACMPVVRVATDAPVKLTGGELPSVPTDRARVAALDERWDLGSSLGRALSALAAAP